MNYFKNKSIILIIVSLHSLQAGQNKFDFTNHSDEDIRQAEQLNWDIFGGKDCFKQYKKRTLEDYRNNISVLLLVKKEKLGVIGFCLFKKIEENPLYKENILYIRWLGIDQKYRRNGIGRELLAYLELIFDPSKITVSAYHEVVNFYVKNDFEITASDSRLFYMEKDCSVKLPNTM